MAKAPTLAKRISKLTQRQLQFAKGTKPYNNLEGQILGLRGLVGKKGKR